MRTRFSVTLLSAAFLFALGCVVWTMRNGYAAVQKPIESRNLALQTEAQVGNLAENVQSPESIDFGEARIQEDTTHALLVRAAKYRQQFAEVATQPGWTYMAYTQTDFLPSTSPKPLPATHQRITWSYFNAYHQVEREIEFFETPETGLTLLGYLQDGVRTSVWHNERSDEQPFTPAYDFSFAKTLQALENEQRAFSVSAQFVTESDRLLEQFALIVPLSAQESQWLPEKLSQEVSAIYETFWFDTQTGALVRYTYDYQLADGTLVAVTRIDKIEFLADVEVPQDILNQLP